MTRVNHESHFAWQAQYLVMLESTSVAPRSVNNVSYVTRINSERHFCVAGAVFVDVGG